MPDIDNHHLLHAVEDCRTNSSAKQELLELYAMVDAEVKSAALECNGCGNCCKFKTAGHLLFASTLELAVLADSNTDRPAPAEPLICKFQIGQSCTARQARPLGCRIFFCQKATAQWETQCYESYHAKIKKLHSKYGIAYTYTEITNSLSLLISNC